MVHFRLGKSLLIMGGGICLIYHIVTFTEGERSNFVYGDSLYNFYRSRKL